VLSFATQQDMTRLGDGYYRGRWLYYRRAQLILGRIPGVDQLEADQVLEIGPYRLPLVHDCHTMDVRDYQVHPTYLHDATKTPWPIEDGRYKVLVALQVWEHLDGKQRKAWQEARRVAEWAVVSVPYLWAKGVGTPDHCGISLDTLAKWTRQRPERYCIVGNELVPLAPRIVCLYNLKAEQLCSSTTRTKR